MILVTGATGNVGQYLVPRLLTKDAPVRVLVRDKSKVAHFGDRVECAVGDLDQPETLLPAMQGVDRLYIVTPDTQQVARLLDAAKAAGVSHVVKQSTIEADRSLGPGKWHRAQEELIMASGLCWTFLRPTMMMVNTIEWWAATIKSHGTVYFPGGKGKVAPVAPADIAAVAATVLTDAPNHNRQIYELTGPESLTIGDMVRTLGTVLGRHLRYVNVPAPLATLWLRRMGLPSYVVTGLVETLGALRRSEYAYVTDAVTQVGAVTPQCYADWCTGNRDAFC
ncbi:MAG: NAD(P)H-binding protein [Caldilineaceae bacterium]